MSIAKFLGTLSYVDCEDHSTIERFVQQAVREAFDEGFRAAWRFWISPCNTEAAIMTDTYQCNRAWTISNTRYQHGDVYNEHK